MAQVHEADPQRVLHPGHGQGIAHRFLVQGVNSVEQALAQQGLQRFAFLLALLGVQVDEDGTKDLGEVGSPLDIAFRQEPGSLLVQTEEGGSQ